MRKVNLKIYNFLLNYGVQNTPELNENAIINWSENANNFINHYNSYLANVRLPDSPGPIEKHPYIDLYHQSFDLHKRYLILGTFPPSSYLNNLELNGLPNPNVQNKNPLHFFYGNLNDLWKFLFNLNKRDISLESIQLKLLENNFSISDVFTFVQRIKMKNSDDIKLINIVLNKNLTNIFNNESVIDTLLFTSGSLAQILNDDIHALNGFKWIIEDYCDIQDFKISGSIDGDGQYFNFDINGINNALNQQNGGIIWWLKYRSKKIKIVNLPSSSRAASINMMNSPFFRKWVNFKAILNNIPLPNLEQLENLRNTYLNLYPDIFIGPPTNQFRREVYTMVLNNTIQNIE